MLNTQKHDEKEQKPQEEKITSCFCMFFNEIKSFVTEEILKPRPRNYRLEEALKGAPFKY